MAASTFDSRQAYQRLREGGMDESAADAVVDILSPFVTQDILQAELAKVQVNLRSELAAIRAEMASGHVRIITFVAALNIGIATIAVAVAALVT